MNGAEAIEIGREALLTVLIVSGPVMAIALLTGLLGSESLGFRTEATL